MPQFLISSLLALFFLSSCASSPKVEDWQLSDGLPERALFVMDIEFKANGLMESHHECEIKARYHTGDTLSFKIRPGKRRYFWSAPEGRYEMKHMSCGLFTQFDLSRFPTFKVKNGEVYYFGQLNSELQTKGSLRWSFSPLDREQLLSQYLSLPNSIKSDLNSPFSRKEINDALIRTTPSGPKAQVGENQDLDEVLSNDWPLSQCQKEERDRNPLTSGLYEVVVRAKESKITVSENSNKAHLYTDDFRECVKVTMKNWALDQDKENFEVTLQM